MSARHANVAVESGSEFSASASASDADLENTSSARVAGSRVEALIAYCQKAQTLIGQRDFAFGFIGLQGTNCIIRCGDDVCSVAALDEVLNAPELDIYTVRTTTPVSRRSQRMGKNRSDYKRIPEELRFYNRTYINACIREVGGTWEVFITKQNTGHNHDITSDTYQTYHEAHQVSDDEVLLTVHTLHRDGASKKRILEYITENSRVVPMLKGIHNLVERLKRESYAFPSVEERIRSILEDFSSKQGNLARF
ncbi:hypothetical protein F444_02560 [Phytophthora nicotianae P1976]|nr:hypothetical protein F444_02560 [Phytophthora nicotianae P1976]